jgi:hypothetical protein
LSGEPGDISSFREARKNEDDYEEEDEDEKFSTSMAARWFVQGEEKGSA